MKALLPGAPLLAALLLSGIAAASPPAVSCSEEQTLSEEVAGSELVVVGELTASRKSVNGTMVTVEADFRTGQTLYSAPGVKTAPQITVVFTCDSAPIPLQQQGYPSVAGHCNEAGLPKTMPPQVSVLTLTAVATKPTLVKRFVWGPCPDIAAVKTKSPHVAGVVAKIQTLKLPAPTVSAPPMMTAAPAASSAAPPTSAPPVNTIAPPVTPPSPASSAAPLPPPPPAKSSGCTMHQFAPHGDGAPLSSLLVAGLVLGAIARKQARRSA